MYSSYERFLRKKILENRKKKSFQKKFSDIFYRFFLLFRPGGRAERAVRGCWRAKRAARRRPRCRSRRLRQQRVTLKYLNTGSYIIIFNVLCDVNEMRSLIHKDVN